MTRILSSAVVLVMLAIAIGQSRAAAPQPDDATSSGSAEKPPGDVPLSQLKEEGKARKGKKEKDHPAESKEAREQRVIAFLEQQNPELAKVLAHLKLRKSHEYDKAVHDLARTETTLTNAKAKDARLYELELRAWQAKTKVDLLVAQSMIAEKAGLEAKLREALSEELKVKADELAYRRERSMAWYDRQIKRSQENRDEIVEARLKKLLGESKKEGKSKGKRAAKAE